MALKNSKKKMLTLGVVNITSGFNNTIVNITDNYGNVMVWSSSGKMGHKGSRKATPYAAQMVAKDVMERAIALGLRSISAIRVQGPGGGRDGALNTVFKYSTDNGITIESISDITPVPHNGTKPPKKRRH